MRKPIRYVGDLAIGEGGPTVPFKFGGEERQENNDHCMKCSDAYEAMHRMVPEKQHRYPLIRKLKEPVLLIAKEADGTFWTRAIEKEAAPCISAYVKSIWEGLPHMFCSVAGFFDDSGHFVPEFGNSWFDVQAEDACIERQRRHKAPPCKRCQT
jgi:hypothetical protein